MTTFGIIILALAALALILVTTYNNLIKLRVACDNAWSNITVYLKRRHDLIPNLVETVKGYAAHEKETLERVIQARNAAVSASPGNIGDQVKAENALSGSLRQLFALSESYPDLKANQNFLELQNSLSDTENQIANIRELYNAAVKDYNTAREQIPGALVVGFGDFPKKDFFQLSEQELAQAQIAPKVSF